MNTHTTYKGVGPSSHQIHQQQPWEKKNHHEGQSSQPIRRSPMEKPTETPGRHENK